ncbi:YtxH domain-containing protein [Glycomyces albidus]|uniref:Uncharacterized protein n=1 Tax=Glycomyces albidus TaxID=2656774 RepID=A0A6L5G5A2_9ACTN|nr:YtxH domain-containing protein [Glycomyces albidus]MQM24812.1 hypothetical protein [Glycomyces albidus]
MEKFNEMKDKAGGMAEDAKAKAEDLYNKAKESPAGDKLDEVSDQVKEKAQGLISKLKGGAESAGLPWSLPATTRRADQSVRPPLPSFASASCASSRRSGATGPTSGPGHCGTRT